MFGLGKYGKLLASLLGQPPEGQGIVFGTYRPADSAYLVEELANERIRDLDLIANDDALSPATRSLVSSRRFHTYEDYLTDLKNRRPTRKDFIDYGASLQRGDADLAGYLAHIRSRDEAFADFLCSPHAAAISRDAFDTSVYVTGETKSGKSYLMETLGFLLAQDPKASVWVLDPHGPLARSCAQWKENLGRNVFYFDISLSADSLPCFNPFDQIPPCAPSQRSGTLDLITQELVNALSMIGDGGGLSGIMRNLLTYSVRLMLSLPHGSLHELTRLLDDERNEDLIDAGRQVDNPFAREFFDVHFGKKTLAVTKAAILSRLTEYLSSSLLFRITTGKSTFSIAEAFNTPGLYIFNLGKGVVGEATSILLGRLLLAQLQAAAFKRERDRETEHRARTVNYVLVDECHNFVNPTTGTIVAETRKYRLSLILGQQFPGQGIEQGLMRNIMTNTPLKFTGVGSEGTYKSIAMSQSVSLESFQGLKPRRFHVSKRGSLPFIAIASGYLAGVEARMTEEEWQAFVARQLGRWYRRGPQEGSGEAKGVRLVSGADPEEFAHERALKSPPGAVRPGVVPYPQYTTIAGVFALMRAKLTGKTRPVSPPTPAIPAGPKPAAPPSVGAPKKPSSLPDGYEPEVEIDSGVFYARKKPRFPRP